ncbi:MAG: hypothetical protein M1835_000300 [Candelina submexicana]|nr:MAG: hypothetical protein M1835_000300 [Candelina submexicana]
MPTSKPPGANAGEQGVNALKNQATRLHGAGESIRGNINQAIDAAAGDKEGVRKNENVANVGVAEMNDAVHRGHGAGVTPVDTKGEKVKQAAQGERTL